MASSKKKEEDTPTYPELLDIPTVTLQEAQLQIELSLTHTQRRGCIVLVGESGLGKTQIFGQIARKYGYQIHPIHTAQYNLMGAGIPRKAEGEFFDIALPSIFPKEGEKGIILFDEINRGLKHAIAMFFTLLEDGRMFNYVLPPQCIVAAAMNPADAAYAVTKLENEPAIRRRVKFLWVEPNPSDWLTYAATPAFHYGDCPVARDKPCHPEILSFFSANPKLIYDVKAQKNNKQYTCPATIQTISEDAYLLGSANIELTSENARTRFGASIGLTMAHQLLAYIENHAVIIGADDVLYRPDKTRRLVQQLVKASAHEKLADLAENVLTLLFADLPKNTVQTAENFLSFCRVLPMEQAASFCQQIRAHANTPAREQYLLSLMRELSANDEWATLQVTFEMVHRKLDIALKS